MTPELLERLRSICLAFPEATEGGGVGDPTFRVRDKIFAMQHGVQGRPSVWCKAEKGVQGALVSSDPDRFFVPPYVGHHGWVGAWLDGRPIWSEINELLRDAFRKRAPKKVAALLDD